MVGPSRIALSPSRTLQDLRADVAALRYLPTLCPTEARRASRCGLPDPGILGCSVCGSEAYFCPSRADAELECTTIGSRSGSPDRLRGTKRLTEPPRPPISSTGGELPGRKMDGWRWSKLNKRRIASSTPAFEICVAVFVNVPFINFTANPFSAANAADCASSSSKSAG